MDINETKAPFFSVIVPTYNNEADLEKCIRSILDQTYLNFELILVDDGSTDSTPEICDYFVKLDYRVKAIHKQNEGAAAARNDGLFRAAGKYIYYVDADDWISKDLLQEAAYVLDVSEAPDIFVFGYSMIMEDGKSVSFPWSLEPGVYNKERLESEIYPRMMNTLGRATQMRLVSGSLCDKIIEKQLLLPHRCRDTRLYSQEDLVCVYECMYFAEQVYFSSLNMYFYNRFGKDSMHRRYHADLFENGRAAAEYLRTYLGGRGNSSIDKQINKIEFDGLVASIYQEIQFGTSIHESACRLREKMRDVETFLVCPVSGLSFSERCYIVLLSFRLLHFTLAISKLVIWMAGIGKRWGLCHG